MFDPTLIEEELCSCRCHYFEGCGVDAALRAERERAEKAEANAKFEGSVAHLMTTTMCGLVNRTLVRLGLPELTDDDDPESAEVYLLRGIAALETRALAAESALAEEQRKFRQETLRTSALSVMLRRVASEILTWDGPPGDLTRRTLAAEIETLLATPLNQNAGETTAEDRDLDALIVLAMKGGDYSHMTRLEVEAALAAARAAALPEDARERAARALHLRALRSGSPPDTDADVAWRNCRQHEWYMEADAVLAALKEVPDAE